MYVVNANRTKSISFHGTFFIEDQPIVGVDEVLLANALKNGEVIEVPDDPDAMRQSARLAAALAAEAAQRAAALGIDLSDPAGLTPEQRAKADEDKRKEEEEAAAAAVAAEAKRKEEEEAAAAAVAAEVEKKKSAGAETGSAETKSAAKGSPMAPGGKQSPSKG